MDYRLQVTNARYTDGPPGLFAGSNLRRKKDTGAISDSDRNRILSATACPLIDCVRSAYRCLHRAISDTATFFPHRQSLPSRGKMFGRDRVRETRCHFAQKASYVRRVSTDLRVEKRDIVDPENKTLPFSRQHSDLITITAGFSFTALQTRRFSHTRKGERVFVSHGCSGDQNCYTIFLCNYFHKLRIDARHRSFCFNSPNEWLCAFRTTIISANFNLYNKCRKYGGLFIVCLRFDFNRWDYFLKYYSSLQSHSAFNVSSRRLK